uniref:Uncharacterized protein n=1 Tax=Palpitomonas bilix TaxID=652834 RepID=A0A7S3CVQ7_9EUKA
MLVTAFWYASSSASFWRDHIFYLIEHCTALRVQPLVSVHSRVGGERLGQYEHITRHGTFRWGEVTLSGHRLTACAVQPMIAQSKPGHPCLWLADVGWSGGGEGMSDN